MKKEVKKVMIGVGTTAAALGLTAAVSYALTDKLVGIAMDRKEPEIMKKSKKILTGSKETAEFLEMLDVVEEKLKSKNLEEVEIISDDGLRLAGHLYCPENPKRVIVAMHGWRSNWAKDFGVIADFWHENDCAVLYAEQRGQGESEGEYMTFGLMERYDCLGWINWVNERFNQSLPIYLGGVSMGATTVLMTAGLELPENVKGIVADCGFTSPADIWEHVVSNNMHIYYGPLKAMFADGISKQRIAMGTNEYSTVEAMKKCMVPVLFIHGTDDTFVPISMTYENYKTCISEKRLLVVPGAEHGMSYVVDKKAYEEAVINLWKEYD